MRIPPLLKFFKGALLGSFLLLSYVSNAQIEVRICPVNKIPATLEFSGTMTVTNNTGVELDLSQGRFTYEWGSIVSLQWPFDQWNASGDNRTFRMNLAYPYKIPDGGTDGDDFNGQYQGTLTIPSSGIYVEGGVTYDVTVTHCATTEAFELYDANVGFNRNCFIYSETSDLCLGEAATEIWAGEGVRDVMIPDDRPSWAIAVMVAHRLFINMTGVEDMVSHHFWMATGLNESAMGCDNSIVPDRVNHCYMTSANHVCEADGIGNAARQTTDNCFQILAYIQLQLNQPDLFNQTNIYGTTNSNNVVGGGNWETGAIGVTYYHYQNMQYWQSIAGQDIWQLFEDTNDPYFIEKFFYHAFHDGFNAGKALLDQIYANYDDAVAATNMNDVIPGSGTWASDVYGSFKVANFTSLLDGNGVVYSQQKTDHTVEYYGCYDDDVSFNDVLYYLDEIKILYPHVMNPTVQAQIQAVFDGVNGGADVPFSNFGPIIDEIVIQMGGHDPSKYLATQYGGSTTYGDTPLGVSLRTDDEICPGEEGVLQVWLAGDADFAVDILYPDGSIHSFTDIDGSPFYITVDQPGDYEVLNYSDANQVGRVSCNFGKVTLPSKNSAIVNWDKSSLDQVEGCASGDLVMLKTGDDEVTVSWTVDGGSSSDVVIGATDWNATVFSPAPAGEYVITSMTPNECGVPISDTLVICDNIICTPPSYSILTPDTTICGGESANVRIELTGSGPFDIHYTSSVDGSSSVMGITQNQHSIALSVSQTITVDSVVVAGCANVTPESVQLTVNATPVALSIGGNAAPACNGSETYTATGGQPGSTYIWTMPSGASGSSSTSSINVNFASSDGDITVQEDLGGGCLGPVQTLAIGLVGCSLSADFEADKIVVCEGDTVTFTDLSSGASVSAVYAWDFGNGNSLTGTSGAGPHQVVYSTAGSIDVSLSLTEGVTANEDKTGYITVNAVPDVPVIAGATEICEGASETFTVSNAAVGANYAWTLPLGFTGTSTSDNISASAGTGAISGDVSVEVDLNGCTVQSSPLAVVVNSLPQAVGSISGLASVCLNDVETYSVATVTGATSYLWDLPSGLTGSSTSESISLTASTLVGGDITITPQNSCGDGASSILNVFIGSVPDQVGAALSSSSGNYDACVGDQVDYAIAGVNGADQYDWVIPANASIVSGQGTAMITLLWNGVGNNAITVTPSSSNCGDGALISQTVNVTDVPSDPIAIIGSAEVCANSQENYSVDMGGAAADSYVWSAVDATINGAFTQVSAAVDVAATDFDLSVVAVNGCGNSNPITSTVTVGNNLQPTVSILDPGSLCEGASTTFNANIGTAGSNPTILWSLNGVGSSTTSSAVLTVSNEDTVEIAVVSDAACKDPLNDRALAQFVVTTITEPIAGAISVSPGTTVCDGETIDISVAAVTNTDDYQWSLPSGWTQIGTGASIQAQVKTTSGTVTVTPIHATCFPSGGQSAQESINVNLAPGNDGVTSGPTDVCENVTVTYSITAVTGADSYSWNLPAGALLQSDNGTSIDVTWSGTGGIVSVDAVNLCGTSTQSSAVNVTINSTATPTITLTSTRPDNAWCESESICVDATLSSGTVVDWYWECDGVRLTGETSDDICLPAVDGCGCTVLVAHATISTGCGDIDVSSDMYEITCDLLPEIDVDLTGPFERCEGSALTITNNGQAQSHSWMFDGVEVATGSQLDRTLLGSDGGPITLEVSNNNACGSLTSADMALQVHLTPDIHFVNDNGNSVVEYITLEDGFTMAVVEEKGGRSESLFDASWTGTTGLINPTSTSFAQVISGIPGEDVLTVTVNDVNDQGLICASTISVAVEILETLKVPNVISPNGDGINDDWQLKAIEAYPNAIVRIFNRWGEPLSVYTGGYQNNPWDGTTDHGKMLPVGTYYYIIDLQDSKNPAPLEGYVELVR